LDEYVNKRIRYETDVLIKKCKIKLMEARWFSKSRRDVVTDQAIIHEAVRLYYAYLLGLIPEDVVERALVELDAAEAGG